MANRFHQLLDNWQQSKDTLQWALATIIETDGSSYRKAGAMLMINSIGRYYGLLSGGCLESDIMRQARRCWENGNNKIIEYDMREEEDLAWQLGIGCGGMVRILLQPVNRQNDYLQLGHLAQVITNNKAVVYQQKVEETQSINQIMPMQKNTPQKRLFEKDGQMYFESVISPPPHLGVLGGGVDALPLVTIASQLGWQVSLTDSRVGYARVSEFPNATHIITDAFDDDKTLRGLKHCDALVIMTHNIELDAKALTLATHTHTKYIGMLGPTHRTERVLKAANLHISDIPVPFANPVGLSLGGELPESIALSILAEIHAFFEHSTARSISQVV